MADFLRQLRNDEKRCTFSMIGTLTDELAVDTTAVPLFVVPKRSTIARMYAITKEAFAAGSTVTIAIYSGSQSGEVIFTNLPLDTDGVVTMGPGDGAGRFDTDEHVNATFNAAAAASPAGEAQIVIEYTEVPVTAGAYTK